MSSEEESRPTGRLGTGAGMYVMVPLTEVLKTGGGGAANQTRHASGDARLSEEMWVSSASRGALNVGGGGGGGDWTSWWRGNSSSAPPKVER